MFLFSEQTLPSHLRDHCYSIISGANYISGIQVKTEINPEGFEKTTKEFGVGFNNSTDCREFQGFNYSCPVYQFSDWHNSNVHDCSERRCHEKYECPLRFVSPDSISKPDLGSLKVVKGNRRKQSMTVSGQTGKLAEGKDCNSNEIQEIVGGPGNFMNRPTSDKFDPTKKEFYCFRDEGNRYTINGKIIRRNENGERVVRVSRYSRPGRPSMTKEQKKEQAILRKRKYEKILAVTVEEKPDVDNILSTSSEKTKKRRPKNEVKSESDLLIKQEPDCGQNCESNELVVVGDVETEDDNLQIDVTDESIEIDDDCIIKEIRDLEFSSCDITNGYDDLFISCSDDNGRRDQKVMSEAKETQTSKLRLGRLHSHKLSSVNKGFAKKNSILSTVKKEKESVKTSASCKAGNKNTSRSKAFKSSESIEYVASSDSAMPNPSCLQTYELSPKVDQSEPFDLPTASSKRTRVANSKLSDFHLPLSISSNSCSPTKSSNRLLSLSSKSTLSSLLNMKRSLKATKS